MSVTTVWRILGVMFAVLLVIAVFHFATRKYLNLYKLIMIFGKKGSGKSTLLTKEAIRHMKKGWTVFSTLEIEGSYKFHIDDMGRKRFPWNSLFLIDEVGLIWDNRDFKNFKFQHKLFFKYQRHFGAKVILFSQTFDVDKKIRDLTDEMFLVKKSFRVFSYAKRIDKNIVLNKSTAESPSKIDEDLVFDTIFLAPFGSRRFTYIPKYIGRFDSYEMVWATGDDKKQNTTTTPEDAVLEPWVKPKEPEEWPDTLFDDDTEDTALP